jgi:hypothetical protein
MGSVLNSFALMDKLLESEEPSIRFRTRIDILGEPLSSSTKKKMQEDIRRSRRVLALLSGRRRNGTLPYHPYAKWQGAHWVLAVLADLRYPKGDNTLLPLREQVYEWLSSESHLQYVKGRKANAVSKASTLFRAHASMEGNALYYLGRLGLTDDRTKDLCDRLLEWQWPDGGWNCDKRAKAHTSSFTESLLPLRGLVHYSKAGKNSHSDSIALAAEFFLERKLFRRKRDGQIINSEFLKLHYPCYWHYDILFGLKVLAEAGYANDERCAEAISILKSKQLKDRGFPAEKSYYRTSRNAIGGASPVSWGGVSAQRMNEFVTCDALCVLKSSIS